MAGTDRPFSVHSLVTSLEQAFATLTASELPALIGELERLKVTLWFRLSSSPRDEGIQSVPSLDEFRHITPAEVGELLNLKEAYIHELCRTGRLPASKHGKYWLISVTALRQWLAAQRRDVDRHRSPALPSRDAESHPAARTPRLGREASGIRRRVQSDDRRSDRRQLDREATPPSRGVIRTTDGM
jgi:excisionase family DNA binding protein